MKCSILLASLAVATLHQPQTRNFHCSGEDAVGQRITVDGNIDVDPNLSSSKRFVIGIVVVNRVDRRDGVSVFQPAQIEAEFSEKAMDLELKGKGFPVYIQTGPTGRARISIRRSWLQGHDYVSECRFFDGPSVAVERLAR